MFDSKELFKYEDHFYVFEDSTLREELINKCYNDSPTNYFDVIKTHKLFVRNYH